MKILEKKLNMTIYSYICKSIDLTHFFHMYYLYFLLSYLQRLLIQIIEKYMIWFCLFFITLLYSSNSKKLIFLIIK